MVSRPHQITQEEEQEVENEAGKKLSRVERRKLSKTEKEEKIVDNKGYHVILVIQSKLGVILWGYLNKLLVY